MSLGACCLLSLFAVTSGVLTCWSSHSFTYVAVCVGLLSYEHPMAHTCVFLSPLWGVWVISMFTVFKLQFQSPQSSENESFQKAFGTKAPSGLW